jgi:hypothetical protein
MSSLRTHSLGRSSMIRGSPTGLPTCWVQLAWSWELLTLAGAIETFHGNRCLDRLLYGISSSRSLPTAKGRVEIVAQFNGNCPSYPRSGDLLFSIKSSGHHQIGSMSMCAISIPRGTGSDLDPTRPVLRARTAFVEGGKGPNVDCSCSKVGTATVQLDCFRSVCFGGVVGGGIGAI